MQCNPFLANLLTGHGRRDILVPAVAVWLVLTADFCKVGSYPSPMASISALCDMLLIVLAFLALEMVPLQSKSKAISAPEAPRAKLRPSTALYGGACLSMSMKLPAMPP